MFKRARERAAEESGYSMAEVLVVIMILGIFAVMGSNSFSCQTHRADDSTTKAHVRAAAAAMENYANENLGAYDGANATTLRAINGEIPSDIIVQPYANCSGDSNTTCFYVRASNSVTGNWYRLTKKTDGRLLSSCQSQQDGSGCPTGGKWSAE